MLSLNGLVSSGDLQTITDHLVVNCLIEKVEITPENLEEIERRTHSWMCGYLAAGGKFNTPF